MKRLLDILIVLVAAPIWVPFAALILLLVVGAHGGPGIFAQDRPGLNGRIFRMYKFRTMTNDRDRDGLLLPDEKRLTAFGRFLRSTSLDELPELLNVLKGEMSLVGPRPLLPEYLPLYSRRQARRHDVLPGITGWAQINGRNALAWEEKFELDVWYVDNQSFALDLRILAITAWKVITRQGISAAGEATMPRFKGTG